MERRKVSPLTDTQRTWILHNFNKYSWSAMEEITNIPKDLVKNFVDYMIKTGMAIRTAKGSRYSALTTPLRESIARQIKKRKIMPKKPEAGPDRRAITSAGHRGHNSRKPTVNDIPKRRDERLPDRKIDTSKCIKVVFKDKNHTTITASDEAHVVRIRKAFSSFEERFGSQLVYP